MNTNRIVTYGYSNPESKSIHQQRWDGNTTLQKQYEDGLQCGACSYYAWFNKDYGLCCNDISPNLCETISEHFTCSALVEEGWGPNSFDDSEEYHCKCGGQSIFEAMQTIIMLFDRPEANDELLSHLGELKQWFENQGDDQGSVTKG